MYNSPGLHWALLSPDLRRERSSLILEDTTSSSMIGIPSGSRWVLLRVAWLLGESIVSSISMAMTDMSSAQFAICVAQVGDLAHRLGAGADQQAWKLSRHAFTDFHNVSRFDSMAGNSSDLIGAFTNLAASTYYTYRAYKVGFSRSFS